MQTLCMFISCQDLLSQYNMYLVSIFRTISNYMNINEKSFYFEHVERLNLQQIKNILDFSSPVGKEVAKRGWDLYQ